MRTLGNITGEGFVSTIHEEDDLRVWFSGDADIDADGANGQSGGQAAYMVGNKGSEHLANGGMGMAGDKVVFTESWGKDIVIHDGRLPRVFPGGVIASKTSYKYPNKPADDPTAYVDSETIAYIVVPPIIISATKGAVMGCQARATFRGVRVDGIVADAGPRNKVGEISIHMARLLGIPHSPRTGGLSRNEVLYELFPGVPGEFCGRKFILQRSNGTYVP